MSEAIETLRGHPEAERRTQAISGFVKPRFEKVREAFAANFERGEELGAACCVFHRGEKVVDLWAGVRDEATQAPWEENTMALVHSTTKGVAALTMALAESRGLFDYEERVSRYWPEFRQFGKDGITVRQLLSHQAGLYALDVKVDKELVRDLDRLAVVLARQKPKWRAGDRQAYHGITLGFYESELLRRVDPRHRSLGQYLRDELTGPLGVEFYIGLPEELPDSRLAPLTRFSMWSALTGLPFELAVAALYPRSKFRRCLEGSELPEQSDHVYARRIEIPAGGGVGTARALATLYGVFATGGKELGLRKQTLEKLMAPAIPPEHGFKDECLKVEVQFSLGFEKPGGGNLYAHPSAFGAPGTGGSFAFADPHSQLGYAYVMNRMGAKLRDDRELAIRSAMYRAIDEPLPWEPKG
jgi:CubicO group peptidase (beta-lactamase class C family)